MNSDASDLPHKTLLKLRNSKADSYIERPADPDREKMLLPGAESSQARPRKEICSEAKPYVSATTMLSDAA